MESESSKVESENSWRA